MNFTILNRFGDYPDDAENYVFLIWDDWNDYSYFTSFGIFYIDKDRNRYDLGAINIGFKGQEKFDRIYGVGHDFTYIGDNYFSMGSSFEYYENLNSVDSDAKMEILKGLNDIARYKDIYDDVENEPVVQTSFFRSINASTVTGQFRRIVMGGVLLTPYSFSFKQPGHNEDILKLDFDVRPDSLPPTNIHVLIGRNGVGKTYLINNMIDSLLTEVYKSGSPGEFIFHENLDNEASTFANLIFISFSAFDESELKAKDAKFINDIKYSYIGLRQRPEENDQNQKIKDPSMLPREFLNSLECCRASGLKKRWINAVSSLQSDPNFAEVGIIGLIELDDSRDSQAFILKLYRRLSSGHKIVLLTITKLIEKLQERSLVIMDEPEAHLHPPLLSAFIRAVSDLLLSINGIAIIATHSPVILQEVPKRSAWRLSRRGSFMTAERPQRETFGENVGILTNDIFRLEVTHSGFYKMITQIIEEKGYDYDAVLKAFDNQLGMEARSIVMAALNSRNQ